MNELMEVVPNAIDGEKGINLHLGNCYFLFVLRVYSYVCAQSKMQYVKRTLGDVYRKKLL